VKAIILAGGLGTRMREETEFRPKPLVEIGGQPVIWHIMKLFDHYGVRDFVVAAGYKSKMLKEYFLNYDAWTNDVSIRIGAPDGITVHRKGRSESWNVTVVDTGALTPTGGRVLRAASHLDGSEPFMVSYGDGLADINISDLLDFHSKAGALATVSAVQPRTRFGVMDIDPDGQVNRFAEKPRLQGWINIGFFVFEHEALRFLTEDSVLEAEPLEHMAHSKQLSAYRHNGFWEPMDTYREYIQLNELWESRSAPWKVWED